VIPADAPKGRLRHTGHGGQQESDTVITEVRQAAHGASLATAPRALNPVEDDRTSGPTRRFFLDLARGASLDTVAFTRCLHTGAKRPLVLSDVRLARQLSDEGTPMLLINRGGVYRHAILLVGEPAMPRLQQALATVASTVDGIPGAAVLLGRRNLDSVEVFRWLPNSSAEAGHVLAAARAPMARTQAELRSGALRIATTFTPALTYTHRLRRIEPPRPTLPTY
jgi:hypothetical protein